MNFIKRAFLSVQARKGKSLLQIFIFTVICVLVLSGLAIQTAATKSADLARQSLGGDVTLQMNMEKIMEKQRGEGGRIRMQSEPIPLESAEKLISYEHVKGYNFFSSTAGIAEDFDPIENEDNENEDSETNDDSMNNKMVIRGGPAMGDVSIQGVLYSDSVQEFMDSQSKLVEGRHITDEDQNKNVTMIEKSLAEENELNVGDTITIQSQDEENSYTLEIIGIYETTSTGNELGMSFKALNPFNKIYVPYTAANEIKGEDFKGTIDSAIYYLDDPANIEAFVSKAQKESNIDFDTFKLDANDALYQQMIGPINNIASFSQNVVYLVTIAGAVILSLIVMLSIRERKYEMGVLLALGEKKWKLIGQYIVELVVIAVIALGISTVSGNVVANKVGDQLLTQQIENEETLERPGSFMGPGMKIGQPGQLMQKVEPVDDLQIEVTLKDLGKLSLIGLLIAIFSTLLPSLTILRLQPKTILSKQD